MKAELVAVGSELLRFVRPDTNGDWLVGRLQGLGIEVAARSLVEDDVGRIATRVRAALEQAELVVVSGGLGPTEDDRTREALAAAAGVPLERDPGMEALLRGRYEAQGYPFHPDQARQADRPRGAVWLDNPLGAAPGLLLERSGRLLAALPGVPAELRAMWREAVEPRLSAPRRAPVALRVLRVAGRTESSVDRALADLYGAPGLDVTVLAGAGIVEVCLRAAGDEGRGRLDGLEAAVRQRLGEDLWGAGDDTLPSVVGRLLLAAGRTVAVAESCTGGALGAALTAAPSSSGWFRGGLIAYHDDVKRGLAGVAPRLLADHGAVSEPVARALARAARERCGSDHGLGVTGIAGPGGGGPGKPVGLVHVALDGAGATEHRRLRLAGDRELVRRRAVVAALDLLRRSLAAGDAGGAGR